MHEKKLAVAAEKMALAGEPFTREFIIELLGIDPDSEAACFLGEGARRFADKVSGSKGRVWASIGLDYKPCAMNCRFCSFGEAFCKTNEAYSLTADEVIEHAGRFNADGVDWITLRTTENYAFSNLTDLARRIRNEVKGDFRLVANTGESNILRTKELKSAGFGYIYHSIRLREGIDTPFSTIKREEVLKTINNSDMDLVFLVEPVGIEHTNEEIADKLLLALKHGAKLTGAMARIPVPGTPLYDLGTLPERRLAQIAAVIRLAAGFNVKDICVHPPSETAMRWGANAAVVDIGAVPRDTQVSMSEWRGFNVRTAKEWFSNAGYR